MDEEVFIPGDLVWLKSGSPRMTVVAVHNEVVDVIYCPYGTTGILKEIIPKIALRHAK